MKLKTLQKDYFNKKIPKPEYIEKMYHFHQFLFEYSQFIKKTDIKKIEITDDTVTVHTRADHIKLVCTPKDHRNIPLEILNFSFYEKDELKMILNLIENDFNILDIGANIGWYSINISKKFNNVKIFPFEPIPITYENLINNIRLNECSNIKPYNFGFSNVNDSILFYYYPEGLMNASLVNLSRKDEIEKIQCEVKTMDSFVDKTKLNVDLIKCDVEGAELLVFQGGIKTINRCKPIIFTELLRKWASKFDYHPNDVIDLLKSIGYKCFVIKNNYLVEIKKIDENTIETNFLFLHYFKHDKYIKKLVKENVI